MTLYDLYFECPDCQQRWLDEATTIIKDDECPRCGSVSLPRHKREYFKRPQEPQD